MYEPVHRAYSIPTIGSCEYIE